MARIKGTKKHDKLKGTNHNDKLFGLGGDDALFGKKGIDKLIGGGGDDKLNAGSGDDIFKGGKGDDTMIAGTGHDKFIGGAGIDTVSYAAAKLGIGIELLAGTGTGDAQFDIFKGIENIDGTKFGDTIEGDASANRLRGLGGDDFLKGGAGNDTIDGGDGNDQIEGGTGADHLIGGNGIDRLVYEHEASGATINLATNVGGGSAAGDTWSGFEFIIGTRFADTITGTGVAETIDGSLGNDSLSGGGGDDLLKGGAGLDTLFGGAGNDRLMPEGDKAEADHLFGGAGSDWADYSNAGAAVTVSLATNVSGGRAAGDTYSSVENVLGSAFDDNITAARNGRAYGGGGVDHVHDSGILGGPAGTEVLRGGPGIDVLSDNFGGVTEDGLRDIFFLEVGLGRDTIEGFSQGTDLFWLPQAQFGDLDFAIGGVLAAGSQVLNKASDHAATIAAAQLIFQKNTHELWYDPDGTGAAAPVEIAVAANLTQIFPNDFLVVPEL